MADTLKDVPEFFEVDVFESLNSRSETLSTFRELGPPDLCQVIKTPLSKASQNVHKDIGSYHYVSGLDCSSSASLAAYINSLTYSLSLNAEKGGWGGQGKGWKIKFGCYCAYNAFSRVDLRVEVKIPGGVEAYVVDLRGERHEATPSLWQETYLSAVLRSILYADDTNYRLAGFRKLDPLPTLEAEQRFLAAVESCFFKGWQLGSEPEIQVATTVENHLTKGVLKYFGDSFRWEPAVNLFEKLVIKDGEVAALLAKAYLGMNEEVKAVQILNRAMTQHSQSYALLHVQVDYLRSKGKMDWALTLAKHAVNCAPSEFVTWAKLTEVHIEMGHYHEALLTLNSCPMFTYNERDLHRMPTPARTHLPTKTFISESGILDDDSARDNEADITLLRLPAPGLRGTFSKAYILLTKLVSCIGWDELLKCRSYVFVMEEEYRLQKAKQGEPEGEDKPIINGNGTRKEHDDEDEDDAASTRAVHKKEEEEDPLPEEPNGSQSPSPTPRPGVERTPSGQSIPTITISSEEQEKGEEEEPKTSLGGEAPGLAKPQIVAQDGTKESLAETQKEVNGLKSTPSSLAFSNKRLCERWLDNLFMVIYEDLRVYTIWRAEVAHWKAQHMVYKKTGTEWEILGDLAQRLYHKEEAKDAYQRCLDLKFSAKAWMKLLEYYADEGDVNRALNAAVRLSTYQHRWYMEMAYPTAVAHHLFKLIRQEGLLKFSNNLVSMNLPQSILKQVMQGYFQYAQVFRIEGSDF
ncbi:chaps-domain-containing protein [Atractiella rhizophila]|nr:chaps-domain-containing protein [Atractiella rhizophila]